MCGLFGAAGMGILQKDLEIVTQLGVVSQFRGLDGAGVFEVNTINPERSSRLYKVAEDWNYLCNMNRFRKAKEKVLDSTGADFIMGHTRAATTGLLNAASCHPFEFSNLVGAHNGTLTLQQYKVKNRVDSELLFEEINKRPMTDVLGELSDKCAYAISLYDKRKKNFVFAMNGLRSLNFAINKKRNILYWASERSALEYIVEKRFQEEVHVFTLRPGIWVCSRDTIRMDNDKIFMGWALENYKKPDKPEPVVYKPTVTAVKTEKKNNVVKITDKVFDATTYEPLKPEDRVPWTSETGAFGRLASCCGKYLTPLEQWEFKNEWDNGYYDETNDEYIHYRCLDPKWDQKQATGAN